MAKKRSKRKSSKKKQLRNNNFIDVPLSDKISLGSLESLGGINYHYQQYQNIFLYFSNLLKKDPKLQKILCFPKNKNEWMNTFIKVNLDDDDINSSELVIKNISLLSPEDNLNKIINMIESCENQGRRFFAITVMLICPGKPGSHANLIIIDLKNKEIEMFEPHGKRSLDSTLDSLVGAYEISNRLLKKFFENILPEYKFISPKDYLPKFGLQGRIDAYTGLCVTYDMLFLHYRILNLDKSRKQIIKYMNTFSKKFILKYVKHVEETLKFENK